MKYKLITYGCQMNKSDSERIAGLLEDIGYKKTHKADEADLILINTCSVRQTAEDRVFGQIKNFAKLKKKNPRLLIGITGCMAGRDKTGELRKSLIATLKKRGPKGASIDLFFPISELNRLPVLINAALSMGISSTFKSVQDAHGHASGYLNIKPKPKERHRGWVVIQTGCSKYCTYCVVPHARGHEKNRPIKDILKEARELAKRGAKEIILLGQTVNSHPKFAEILKELNKIKEINRIGFESAHPMHMTPEIIKALALPKMINFLHLPVQSGNNEILRKMNRNYTREKYLKIISQIRKVCPGIALATDIIVGFTGETKTKFKETISLYKEADFDMSYNAMYSQRTGTSAYKSLKDDISREEKRLRWKILHELMKKNVLRKNKKYLNKEVEVLVDGCKAGKCYGLSREYKKVIFPGKKSLIGEIVNVKINKIKEWELEGIVNNE